MIYGIGTDLTEISRIRRACERDTFLTKNFSDEERRQALGSFSKLAGDFAVKEAVSKAMGTGILFPLTDIECLRAESGKPYVRISGEAERIVASISPDYRIHVSISNTKELVSAVAVLEYI